MLQHTKWNVEWNNAATKKTETEENSGRAQRKLDCMQSDFVLYDQTSEMKYCGLWPKI